MSFITRFAPSPTGPLHLGHAYSALLAHDMAIAQHGIFLLRIEDIDQGRSRPEWEAQIKDDLAWLGLAWPGPVMRQSERGARYDGALRTLWERGLIYPCACTRRDIAAAASAPQEGAPLGPDGVIYPGTCRPSHRNREPGPRPHETALRLDMGAALDSIAAHSGGAPLAFTETGGSTIRFVPVAAETAQEGIGDIVLARRDMGTSYHLSAVLDDADQRVTHVVRGADLFAATAIHVILQRLLDLPTPVYHHHRLIRDADGKRLAKRDDARAIARYRNDGVSAAQIREMVGLP